jgi:hypothetical protein
MNTTLEPEPRTIDGAESLRELPCGCTSVTTTTGYLEIRWCPHHGAIHGIVPGTKEISELTHGRRL